ASLESARTNVFGRSGGRGYRRPRLRAAGGATLEHGPPRALRRAAHRRVAAANRAPARRAFRRQLGVAHAADLRASATHGDGGAVRRRRGRGFWRLRSIPLGGARREAGFTSAAAPRARPSAAPPTVAATSLRREPVRT